MHDHGLLSLKERIEELEALCEQLLQENHELGGRVNGLEWGVDDEMEIEEGPPGGRRPGGGRRQAGERGLNFGDYGRPGAGV
jgi:hypothetical protein